MRKLLTIGEVSKLLNISTYSIRYYEKEGLISPTSISDNGYRLYNFDAINTISVVILLREGGVPIREINELEKNYDLNVYRTMIEKSYANLLTETKRLDFMKKRLKETMHFIDSFEERNHTFEIKQLPERAFCILTQKGYDWQYPIKEIYNVFDKNNIDMKELYKEDLYYVLQNDQIIYCRMDNLQQCDLNYFHYKAGNYLTYRFYIDESEQLKDLIKKTYIHAINNELEVEGELLMLSDVNSSMLYAKGFGGELQIKIK